MTFLTRSTRRAVSDNRSAPLFITLAPGSGSASLFATMSSSTSSSTCRQNPQLPQYINEGKHDSPTVPMRALTTASIHL